jgi:hypothetical protein
MKDMDQNMNFLLFVERYQLVEPLLKERDVFYESLTYSTRLYVPAGLIQKLIFIGNIPLMTSQGTFIINGIKLFCNYKYNRKFESFGPSYRSMITDLYSFNSKLNFISNIKKFVRVILEFNIFSLGELCTFLSTGSNSNLIAFHTSQAAASSRLHLAAARIISLPSRARSRPSLQACTHASKATLLAIAPGAFPQG